MGYWRDPLANTGEPLRLDTGRMLGRIHRQGILSGILGEIHWRATLGISGILSGMLGGIHWRAALAGCSAGSTDKPLWRDTRQDPLLASQSGGMGFTGEQLWRDTGRDPLASCSGEILGGIHWRAALAGFLGEIH